MIRRFRPADLPRVLAIWLEGNRQAHPFIPDAFWLGQLPAVRAALPAADVYVYTDGAGAVQGFIGLQQGYIAGLFVRRAFRSRGVGRRLLGVAKRRCGRCTLGVYVRNTRALGFYRRQGFGIQAVCIDAHTGQREARMVWPRETGASRPAVRGGLSL